MGISLILFFYVYQNNELCAKVQEKVEEEISLDLYLTLKNIMDDEPKLKVSSHRQIFFLETHLDEERKMDKPRAACAVESAGL
jgi:hypothetical protein